MTRSAAVADDRRDQAGQDGRVVAEVGVHLDDDRGAAGDGDAEPVEVGPAETLLGGPVADADPRIGGRQIVGQPAGPVGRPVVDHEEGRSRELLEDRRGDRPEVLRLVVGRQDDPGPGPHRLARLGSGQG